MPDTAAVTSETAVQKIADRLIGVGRPDGAPLPSTPPDSGVDFEIIATGDQEVPGPGDSDGRMDGTLSVSDDRVCVEATLSGLDPLTAVHVHRGAVGQSGEVVVNLPVDGTATTLDTCAVDVDPDHTGEIRATPAEFYVNAHTDACPADAVRAQLSTP